MKPRLQRSMVCIGLISLCVALPGMAEEIGRSEVGRNPFLHSDNEVLLSSTIGRGDQISPRAVTANGTYSLDLDDDLDLLGNVFKGGTPPEPCEANGDVNCSGSVTSADIIYLVNYVFKGGPPPPL